MRTILVTGSTDGIGLQTALQLAAMGEQVLLHGRSLDRGLCVREAICARTGNRLLRFFRADLSSQKQVHRLAVEIRENCPRMHVLINNTGTFKPERRSTREGLETTFAVNYLAPFLLTYELLDLLKESAPARIVNVVSIAHRSVTLDWRNLHGERRYTGFKAYARSKLALILFTYALAERLKGTGIIANCLHPGVIRTKLLRAGFGDYPGDSPGWKESQAGTLK